MMQQVKMIVIKLKLDVTFILIHVLNYKMIVYNIMH